MPDVTASELAEWLRPVVGGKTEVVIGSLHLFRDFNGEWVGNFAGTDAALTKSARDRAIGECVDSLGVINPIGLTPKEVLTQAIRAIYTLAQKEPPRDSR